VGEHAHLNKTKFSIIFHGKISSDGAKYLMTSHGIFYHATKLFFRINKGLLTLNMGLENKALESNLM
jgi:hypothetical protein